MGYHTIKIPKGQLGEFSKIEEEFLELKDVISNPILELCEIADLLGAIKAYLKRYNISIEEALMMTRATESAFRDGERN